jgi:lysyl-tRNA synthetase class 2
MEINFRILNRRLHGRSAFLDVLSESINIQVYINTDTSNFTEITEAPLGTFVRATGEYFTTRTGHNTFRISDAEILHIPQNILPVVQDDGVNRYNEISNVETVRRRRYLQTILDPTERNVFITRSRVISSIRNFFVSNNYLEVETPILQPIYGGAEATPFITHHEALDMNFYLRIAPELYLRRMIIGGYDRVFEIGRNFRNEGISSRHNPEFTFIEIYTAFQNYMYSMDIISSLFTSLHNEFGEITYNENIINLSNIRRERYLDLVNMYSPVNITGLTDTQINDIFEEYVEPHLIQPTIVYDYPSSISPLSQRMTDNPSIAERFELYIAGMEIANAYSELNDVQQHIENLGQEDSDFIEALSYGMPPTTGIGIGIDRIIMLITNRVIRDVIFFPSMRLQNN